MIANTFATSTHFHTLASLVIYEILHFHMLELTGPFCFDLSQRNKDFNNSMRVGFKRGILSISNTKPRGWELDHT